ncbi:MAG: PA14 domain-containing protein, partial [Deltaproteobacteria bacterium]|nr:PA14 domain-containing protein [Deltaproteobacteria bacterium]
MRSGNSSLMIAGYSRADYAYCYYRVFDLNLNVVPGMKIGYWIYHTEGTGKIAVDGHFTDGNTLRDFGSGALQDQYGVRVHPALRQDPMSQWYYVEVDLSPAAGKTLDTIMFAFDNGGDKFKGQYRTYVDDLRIFKENPCQASVSETNWKGEYFNNLTLSGGPSMVRDDGDGFINFDWGLGSPNSSCGIGEDHFSVRWTRSVYFPPGNYQFTVTGDDGVRFWIDDQLKLDKWFDQGPTDYPVGPISLSGNHTLRMEYYENAIGAVAKLSWQKVEPPISHCQANVSETNWKGEYFNNMALSGTPVMVRDDGQDFLNFDWGLGSPESSCGIGIDHFSVRWTRRIDFIPGQYQFTATVDDGVRLYIDDQLQLEKWIDQPPTPYTVGPIYLSGSHTLRVEYYENSGGAVAKLSWLLVGPPPFTGTLL